MLEIASSMEREVHIRPKREINSICLCNEKKAHYGLIKKILVHNMIYLSYSGEAGNSLE